jgi:prefoldin subunit 5
MDKVENRLTKLEWQTHEHAEEIREVKRTADDLTKALSDISACLQQIKFTAFGAVVMLIMNQLGLTDTMALILSK